MVTDLEIIYTCLTVMFGLTGLTNAKGAPFAAGVMLNVQLVGIGYTLTTTAFLAAMLIFVGSIVYGLGFCVAQIAYWSGT